MGNSKNSDYKNKPNYGVAKEFLNKLAIWRGLSGKTELLESITSITAEEINQALDIIKKKLEAYEERPKEPEFKEFSNNLGMMDPYLIKIKEENKIYDNNIPFWIDLILRNSISYGDYTPMNIDIENEMLTGNTKKTFDRFFGDTIYANDSAFIDAIINTRKKYYEWRLLKYIKPLEEYDERRKNDIESLLNIDGFKITISFIMNIDDSFDINMMETYTEVTLNCLNNLKVYFNAGNSENAGNILNYIYRGFTPKIF
jgi:hypothetical protein